MQALSPALSQREKEMKEDPPATADGRVLNAD